MSTITVHPVAVSAVLPPPSPASVVPTGALADIVEGLAGAPALWSDALTDLGAERSSIRLLETPAYDVWLIRWPPGTRVEPHDHGASAGAFTVVRGALTEYRWSPDARQGSVGRGDVVTIDARVVHDVVADRPEHGAATSIHAYSPPLREMGFYSSDGTRLLTRVAIEPDGPPGNR